MKLARSASDRTIAFPLLVLVACGAPVALGGCSGDDTEMPLPDAGTGDAAADGGRDGAVSADGSADASGADVDATIPASDGEAGDAGPRVTDGGPDATADGPTFDAGPPPFSCTAWKNPSPIVLEDLTLDDAQGAYVGSLWVGEPSAGQLRVVAQPAGTSFRVYMLAKGTATTTTFDGPAPSGEVILESTKYFSLTPGGTVAQILLDDVGGASETYSSYLVPDTVTSAATLPAPITFQGGTVASFPLTTSQLFVAEESSAVYEVTNTLYTLDVGLAPGTQAFLDNSINEDIFLSPQMAHAGGEMYLFSTDKLGALSASAWGVPDDGGVASPPVQPRTFDTGEIGFLIDVAPGVAAGTTNFAYYTLPADQSSATFRVGQVANAELGTVTGGSLQAVQTFPDLTAAPLSGVTIAEWTGDEIAVTGTGTALGDGGAARGATFLWANAVGELRAVQSGPDAILQSETNPIAEMVAAPSAASATSAEWDVVWVEHFPGGDKLLYNELDCEPAD